MMMVSDSCKAVVQSLIKHLASEFHIEMDGDLCIVTTPFVHLDQASIEFYVHPSNGGYLLTDEGETLNMLFVNGMNIEANKHLLEQVGYIARFHGVTYQESELIIEATTDNLGAASFQLLNAIQAIGYLLYKRSHRTITTFDDEVEELMLELEIVYDQHYSIRGEANEHRVRFHLNSGRNILLEPVSAHAVRSARNKAKSIAYQWVDIRGVYQTRYQFVVIIDDRENRWEKYWSDDEARNAIITYSDTVLRWDAQKPQLIQFLTNKET